jgi:hypothetical protein
VKEEIMTKLTTGLAANTSCLADILWKELRGLADDGLARRAAAAGSTRDNRIRGEIYLFIMDVIAQQIDRLFPKPVPEERRRVEVESAERRP